MERVRARQLRGLRTDDRILDAAVVTVAELGADRAGLRDVAAGAGLTYGALYARYGNVAELLADLWERRAVGTLRALAEAAATFRPTAEDAPERLHTILGADPARRTLVDLLGMAARVDDLADVVPSSAASVLRGAGLLPDPAEAGGLPDVLGLGILGLALGSIAQGPIDGGRGGDAAAIAAWLRA
ncbi:MAG: TetR family transcriptional regulator, partial [Chloroflexota bacterium]